MSATVRGLLQRMRGRLWRVRPVARYLMREFRTVYELLWLREGRLQHPEGWPPGHFYSPIPSLDEIKRHEAEIFAIPREVPGVDLNEAGQLALMRELAKLYPDVPYVSGGSARYTPDNPNFAAPEAITLYAMIVHRRPERIIEVGSGYSSLVILDALDRVGGEGVECRMIEPYPERLRSLLGRGDERRITLVERGLQDVETEVFSGLRDGDILFIDSTHVSKTNSDVNHALGRVLPSLAQGVRVHFHDIFWPFEYPRLWVFQGHAWNEAYAVRAFLQYNTAFRIEFFTSYLWYIHRKALESAMPLVAANGSSLWLRRL